MARRQQRQLITRQHWCKWTSPYTAALDADANYAKAGVSLARVEEVADAQTDATPLDLIALAAAFTVTPAADIQTVAEIDAEPEVAIAEIEQ